MTIKNYQKILVIGDKASSAAPIAPKFSTDDVEIEDIPQGYNFPSNSFDMLHDLPMELRLVIFGYLSAIDLAQCAGVSREWAKLASSSSIWYQLFSSTWFLLNEALPLVENGDWKSQFVRRQRIDENAKSGTFRLLGAMSVGNVVCADVVVRILTQASVIQSNFCLIQWTPRVKNELRSIPFISFILCLLMRT